jgi:hypothetical protein
MECQFMKISRDFFPFQNMQVIVHVDHFSKKVLGKPIWNQQDNSNEYSKNYVCNTTLLYIYDYMTAWIPISMNSTTGI